jgi:hypothetical protein
VVHLEHAAAAGRAVVGAVGLPGLALLAEAHLAVGLDGEGGGQRGGVCGQSAVAIVVGGAAGRGEDGCCVAPVEEKVEDNAGQGGAPACLGSNGNAVSLRGVFRSCRSQVRRDATHLANSLWRA